MITSRFSAWACFAATCCLAAGCGGGRPKTLPIEGRVTLAKGGWPIEGEVYFIPLKPAEGYPRRAARAKFDSDGVFSSPTSWEEGDGIVPGTYKVFIACWKVRPTGTGPPPISYVAPEYQNATLSDLEVEITPESARQKFEWDFPRNPQLGPI